MYIGTRGGVALVREIGRAFRGKEVMPEVVVCPSFLALSDVSKIVSRSRIKLGAQDAFWEDEGSHTGSIGPKMLKEAGCSYVIIGHSERRKELGETNAMISKKVSIAIKSGLNVVLCIGETKDEREAGKTDDIIAAQLRQALAGVKLHEASQLLVAYEPIWAISGSGKGGAEDVVDVVDAFATIRAILKDVLGLIGKDVPLLYGGSVDADNAYSYLREDVIDGVLVGHASVKTHHILDIIASALKAMRPE